MAHLRIGKDLIECIDRRTRHVVLQKKRQPMIAFVPDEDGREHGPERFVILLPVALCLETKIGLPFRMADDLCQPLPELRWRREMNDEALPPSVEERINLRRSGPRLA